MANSNSLLSNYISQRSNLSESELNEFLESFKLNSFSKNEVVLRANQQAKHLYFIESGTLRTYTETEAKEITTWIYPEGMFITSWYSFLEQDESLEFIESLEESKVYSINYQQLEDLYSKYPSIDRFGRKMVQEQLSFIDYYSRGYQFLSAKERYDLLLSFFPDITLRVKLGYIASMLGLTNETLSRIRAQKP